MTSASPTFLQITTARSVPRPKAAEAAAAARAELASFLELISELEPADLDQPTHCSLWSVRDIVAHQASHAQSGSGIKGFVAQLDPRLTRPYRSTGMSMLDALNQAQVDRRKDQPFDRVVAELKQRTDASINARVRLHPLTRVLRVPVDPVGLMPLSTLLTEIFPRDMWIHRLDIADATGRPFGLDADHNEAMVAGIVRDAAKHASKRLRGTAAARSGRPGMVVRPGRRRVAGDGRRRFRAAGERAGDRRAGVRAYDDRGAARRRDTGAVGAGRAVLRTMADALRTANVRRRCGAGSATRRFFASLRMTERGTSLAASPRRDRHRLSP